MNIFDILPKELWIHIILYIPCKYIPRICNVSVQFRDLCVYQNLFQKRKMKGFPRKSGRFKIHKLLEYEGYLCNKYKAFMKSNFSNISKISTCENKNIIKNVSDSLVDLLYNNNIDLTCGDIIDFGLTSEEFLFDGNGIVDLKINHFYYLIPNDICPIKNNVPIKYWDKRSLRDITFTISITNIRDELIENISKNNYQIAYTWFTLNNRTYVIYHSNFDLLTSLLADDNLSKKDSIYVYLTINHIGEEMYTFNIKDKIITNKYYIASRSRFY